MPFPIPQPQQTTANNVENLFRAANVATIKRGSLILFNYMMWIHDPYPLVLVSDVRTGLMIKGINIHYLTFPFIKDLLRGAATFNYQSIKANKFLTRSFRSYKWGGVRQIKSLDIEMMLNMMGTVRSVDPNQIKSIRESVQQQLQRAVNPKATPTAQQGLTTPTQGEKVGPDLGNNVNMTK